MAAFALTNPYVSVAANDLSSYVKSVEFKLNGETQDVTAMSAAAWRAFVAGLKDWEVSVTINTDVAAGLADSILWPLYMTQVAIEIRATGSAVSTSNPKWTGNAIVVPDQIFGGSVGDAAETSFSLKGTGALTRATA